MISKPSLHTLLSPRLLDSYDLHNSLVVIIDVFRATSTIAAALYNGAQRIIPVESVEKCKAIGEKVNGITAGEREGKIIEGLSHGNSPSEYTEALIKGKTLVLTTTNGTKLLHMALKNGASEIITGSFPNLSSVIRYVKQSNKNILLGCSGWKDRFNLEDTMFAGAIVSKVKDYFTIHCDASLMAEQMYLAHQHDMHSFIRQLTHYHRLAAFGLEKDLDFCISENVADVLPYYKKGDLMILS